MAFSLFKKVNEKVLSSVSLLDASLDVDYSIANIRNSITSGNADKIEIGIESLLNFSEENANALILQREWVEVVFQVIKWMGTDVNVGIFGKILQLIIKMIQNETDTECMGIKCCNPFVLTLFNSENDVIVEKKMNYKMIEEIVEISKGGTLLIQVLKNLNYEETDIYIKYDIVKILCIIQRSELGRYKLDEIILSQGDTIGMLLELLSDGLKDYSSYLQNTLELLMLLTKKNSEVQKIITYNGSAQRIINIVSEELEIMLKDVNNDNLIDFSSSDKIFNSFIGTVDLKSCDYSNIKIIELSIEILYHISQSSNCLNYIIESQYNENNKLIVLLEKLLGYYTLLMEHNSFKFDWNKFNVGENRSEAERIKSEKDDLIVYSILVKTLDILILYCSQLKKYDDKSLERIQEIILYTILNIDYIKYGVIDKIKDLLNIFMINNIKMTGNVRWLLLELSSGVTPSIWYGFNKIIMDYTPTIKYIAENKLSDNEQHMKQIEELRIKYVSQMETSILYWLDKMIISKSDMTKVINRDEWVHDLLLNSVNLTSNFEFSSIVPNEKGLLRSDLFTNYISLCFWFPVLEFHNLSKSSFFSEFEDQLLYFDGKINDNCDNKDEQKIHLTLKYHYRIFRTLQGLQMMILDYEDSPEFLIGGFGHPKTIQDLTNDIWNPNSTNNLKSRSYCDLSDEFPKEVFNNTLEITKYMVNDIYNSLEKNDISNGNSNNSVSINFINSYCIREPKDCTDNDTKYNFNSLTTLVQSLISLIIVNIKSDSELEIPEKTLKELKKLNEKIKGVMINRDKHNNFCLVTDLVNIIFYNTGIMKNSNLITQIIKRLGTGIYNNKMVFLKKSYLCIIQSLSKLNNKIFYPRDSNFGKYGNNINNKIIDNRSHSNISGNIGDIDLPSLNDLVDGREERVMLGEEVDGCCMNCIYLNEKMYQEREYFSNLIKKKQEEIDVLVKAYIESRDIIFGKKDILIDKNTYNEKDNDYMILIEMIGILRRRFPQVRRFIENNFLLSSKTKSDILNSINVQVNELKDVDYEYIHDFSDENLNIGVEAIYQDDEGNIDDKYEDGTSYVNNTTDHDSSVYNVNEKNNDSVSNNDLANEHQNSETQ
ncbi:VDP USO1 YBL047C family vesicular transport factor [Cryptosporidium xiaoi]|uniref:VDP USO1 YBL047C family vesicular transport factor n=1 Tax=Cryptosporidium xiaoi TaxID=659607 RepID=A0AAV9XSR9_9CRYT